ncbi:MAG: hypothetical protein QOC81_3411 [Thermoanaerobaculia bacterium]|jgi:uncharacterized repeat protein (TIGR01451 family)|nr:hypothetical protein [Thermoanaerobaculia bacterium]
MPTLNNDVPVVAVNPVDDAAQTRSLRIVGASLGATLITLFVLFAAMALAPADARAANTCTLTSTAPVTLWADPTKWSGCGGTYPGQSGGDTAIVNLGGSYTLKVDSFVNPVTLQIGTNFPGVQVASGGTLTLESSSTATTGDTFTVLPGGTMGTNTGANISNFQGNVTVSGGTFNSQGTIQFSGGNFTFSGGTLNGSGTISVNAASFTGATSAMSMDATKVFIFGSLDYSGSANALTMSNGAKIYAFSGTFFNLQNDLGINGTASEEINIQSGGTLRKTAGSTFNIISVSVNNGGTIDTSSAPSGGSIGLSGPGIGTHSGSFTTGSSNNFIAFGGNNAFNSGTAFSGGSLIELKGGTQTFNASVTANSGIKWLGGTITGTGPLIIPNTASMIFDGSVSGMTLNGALHSAATMTYAPANLLTIDSAGFFQVTGSLLIAGDYDILSPAGLPGTLKYGPGGTLTKTGGTNGSTIYAQLDSGFPGGTLGNTATGPLNIAADDVWSGASAGPIVPAAGSSINFTTGTFDAGGTFSGSGTVNVAGGTLNINTATSFGSGTPNLNINGGKLGGTGTVSILGSSNWTSGTITGSSPFNISSTGVLAITGSAGAMTLDGRVLNDSSSVVYNSPTNNLTLKNSASIVNSGTFTAIGGGTIATDGSAVSISNNSQFNKTSAGLFIIEPAFNNAGTGVSITGGVLDIDATGTSSAPWAMSAGTEVWFPTPSAGTYTWASGTTFTGGKVTIDGSGTVATSFPMTVNNTNMEVKGGTFSTPNTFTVTTPGTLKWKGGTLTGAGHTVISSGTTFDMLTELAARTMTTHTIDNAGNATMSALTQPISLNSSSVFNNSGTLDIQSDGAMLTDGAGVNTFDNSGTVKKTVGGSGFRFDVPYTQSAGTTDANSPTSGSTIIFNNGGTLSGGALQATSSTNFVDFFNGTFTINGGSFNNGQPGALRINGGGAVVTLTVAISATNFIQNFGLFQGAAGLNVPSGGTYTWNGGTMKGTGGMTIATGGTLDVAGTSSSALSLFSKSIINSGTITYHPLSGGTSNQLTLTGSSTIVNNSGGLINVTDNSSFLQNVGANTIINSGNFLTSGSSSVAPTVTNNATGLIKPSGGTLTLLAGTSNGTLDAVSPGAINFGSGSTFTITGGTWGGSGGGFWVTGGTVSFNANYSLTNLTLNSGQVDGTGVLTLTGSNAWGGGTMAGSGSTTNSGSATLTMSNNLSSFLDARTFNNNGTVVYQNGGSVLRLQNGALVANTGSFDVQGDVGIACNCATPPTFHNLGSFYKTAGTGIAVVNVPFNNDGTVAANLGTLQFTANGSHNGVFSMLAAGSINFAGNNTFNAPSTMSGAGKIVFDSGSSTIASSLVTPGTLTLNSGTVTLNAPATVGTFNIHNAAALSGTGALTINGTSPLSEWTGGTISGSGTLTVGSSSNFIIDGLTAAMTLNTRPIVNNGNVTYGSTTNGLILANGAVITNASGATLNLDAGPGIGVSGINNAISNNGLMQRSTAGTLGISPAVVNTATINANNGVLAFNGGLTQNTGSTNLLGGSISSPSTIALSGGTFTGNGTVSAAVNNTNGIVAPGNPSTAGTLTITGAYSQGVNGGMSLKIGGTSNYDIVDATASGVTLGGTVTVSLFNAFTPASGNTFDILKFSTRSGDFATYNLPTFAGGGSFQKAFVAGSPNVLRLTAIVTSSDLSISQVAPSSLLHGQNGTWTLTITNGPTPVTNVSVTDTFANASFVSATSVGACTPSGSTVTCAIGSLAANQSVNVSLILNASSLVTIANGASVTATEFDPNTSNNNTGNAFTAVLPAADLTISNTASGNPVNAGSPLSFVLSVSNNGPDATSGTITVSNTVPAGVTSATGSGTGWTCGAQSGSVITCTSNTSIPSSGSAQPLTISMTAPATGPAVDSASVSALTSDPNSGNNSASQTVTITPKADLSITKNTSSAGVAGQTMVYTVVVTNNGPSSAASVSVADTTPAGLTFVSNSGGCTTAYPCALGTLTNGQSVTITSTYTIAPSAAGSVVTNTAIVSSSTADPSASNNTAAKTTSITGSADLTITKAGPASSSAGSTLSYTITVTNNGPSDAAAVTVTDATPANTTFVSNSGACVSAFPCALGTMTPGQSKTITSDFSVSPSFTGSTIANSANATSSTADPITSNNTSTATTTFSGGADLAITKTGPASANSGSSVTYTLTITNNGPNTAVNVVVNDPVTAGLTFTGATGACPGGFPCGISSLGAGQSVTALATYTVTATSGSVTNNAQVSSAGDTNGANDNSSATTLVLTAACGQQPPSLTAPVNGATIGSPVTFTWTAVPGATSYKVFASIGGASTQEIGSTASTSLTVPIASGSVTWSVQALGVPNCSQLTSANGTFSVCSLDAPVIAVVGTNTSGQTYTVQWTPLPGITNYELQEAATAAFDNPTSFTVTGTSKTFTKTAATPTAFFYRVRGSGGCSQNGGPFSSSERVVIVPIPAINTQDNSATVDINNKKIVVQTVFIPGQGPATPYFATTDQPWLTVSPATGTLLPQGITLQVFADPADLPNGTFTATIILTLGTSGKAGALDTKPAVSVPVSISVVTPVSPATLSTPPSNSLIIPSVGHLDGINSQWRSDVRITNTAAVKNNYLLRFTPAGGDNTQIKQTQITIAANDTTALDDIVKNWYGVGALGDAANGVLEVRPLTTSGKGTPNEEDVNVSLVTVASSRTFNQSAGGTLGQYIPAIPFANFVGKVSGDARAGILSMQQISQSAAYRTNLGIVEASGKPASVLVSVFDAAGKNLLDLPIDLKAGEQQQLNSFLALKNITLTDGRIEVKVTGGDGKVIAYASVVDNKTTDPLLVTGVPLAQTPARTFVLPGVADLSNGLANWRTDLRVFNSGTDPQYVTMTLYPQTGSASSEPLSRSVSINPGEVTILDNILSSRFGVTNIGGALHVDTLADANLVVTGRTYNQVEGGGTYGQFIGAVTPADAVGKGGRTLNVLQVEDSTRYRTNLGIAEVNGKPATVEVSVILPDAKVVPKLQIPLAANEYRQFRVLQQLGVGTAYNARITIRVIDGDGKIAAYGSVIDMLTQDPTYVPAQ